MVSTQEGRVLHGEGSEADWFGEDTPKAEIGSNSAEKNRFLQSKAKVTTHGKKKEILDSADYAFTGSYYNTHRNIMNFDPIDLMPKYRGAVLIFSALCHILILLIIRSFTISHSTIAFHALSLGHQCIDCLLVHTCVNNR